MQGQKQQKWPTIVRILIFLLALLLILRGGFIWVRDSLGSETNLFTAIFAVGGVAVGLFQLIPLLKCFGQALATGGEVGDRGGEGITLHHIGIIYYIEKRYDVALSFFILAQRIFVEVQSSNSDAVQEWIDYIHRAIGDQQFAARRQRVESQAQQIVGEALSEL